MIKRLLSTHDSLAAFILRVTLGLVIFPHGAQKLFGAFGGHGFSGTMDFLTGGAGLPWIVALIVIFTEAIGSLLLVIGLLGRVWAFLIGCVMAGAMLTAHLSNGFFMNWTGQQKGEGFEYHLLALGIVLAILIIGSGRYSVDLALQNRRR
jgi:putative oxidoreductase